MTSIVLPSPYTADNARGIGLGIDRTDLSGELGYWVAPRCDAYVWGLRPGEPA